MLNDCSNINPNAERLLMDFIDDKGRVSGIINVINVLAVLLVLVVVGVGTTIVLGADQ